MPDGYDLPKSWRLGLESSAEVGRPLDVKTQPVQFWTNVQYTGFLEGLMRELTGRGMPARQCFCVSESAYRSARGPLSRLWLRVRQYIVFPLQMMISLFLGRLSGGGKQPVVVTTNPFFAPLLATLVHPRVIQLVYDIFPEAMIHSGKWQDGTLRARIIRWVVGISLRRSRRNVFLGQRLREYVESLHGETGPSAVIAVGADQNLFPGDWTSPKAEISHRPTILYCGNFGNLHDAETFFDLWRSDSEFVAGIDWRFHCTGPKRTALEKVLAELTPELAGCIHLGSGLPPSEWVDTMRAADVALVTMSSGAERVVMPSKTYSALMAGQAILAIAPLDSDLASLVHEADCGWCVQPGDVSHLDSVLQGIVGNPDELVRLRSNAWNHARSRYGQDALSAIWHDLLAAE